MCYQDKRLDGGDHWSRSIPNTDRFWTLVDQLSKKLDSEMLPLSGENAGSWTQGGEHLFSGIASTPDNRVSQRDIKCALEDMGIGDHFKDALPCRMNALYGPGQRSRSEKEHMNDLQNYRGLADEWWFVPITGGVIKHLEAMLKPESKENLMRAHKHFALLVQEDPWELRYDIMKQGRLSKGDNPVELERQLTKFGEQIKVGYHATATNRLPQILKEGFAVGPNYCRDAQGIHSELRQHAECLKTYTTYTSKYCQSKPGYLIATILTSHLDLQFTTRTGAGSGNQRHQRVTKKGAIMPTGLIIHIIHPSRLRERSCGNLYRMPLEEFESRQINIQAWHDWKEAQRVKAEKQRLLDKTREAAWREKEGLPPIVEVDDREYSEPIDRLQPGLLVDGRPLNPTARHPDEIVYPGGPSQGSQRAGTILGTSVAALTTNPALEMIAERPSQAAQEGISAAEPFSILRGPVGVAHLSRVEHRENIGSYTSASHGGVMTVVHGTVGHQRFAMDRSSGAGHDQPPPPKASRTAEPKATSSAVVARLIDPNDPVVYDLWQNPGVQYRNAEAWRMYDNDMCAYHMLQELEGRAARDDDLGIHNEFPGLRPWQRIPPVPPRRENVQQSSTSSAGQTSRLVGDQSHNPEESREPPREDEELG